jgi:hypothetical protein
LRSSPTTGTRSVDSLFLALLFAGLYVAKYGRKNTAWVASCLLLFCAYKTKQLAFPFLFLPLPLLFRQSARRAALYAAVGVLLVAGDLIVENTVTRGWYTFYTSTIPRGQAYIWGRVFVGYPVRVLSDVPVLAIAAIAGAARNLRSRRVLDALCDTWTLASAIGALATVVAWARPGGAPNNLETTYVFAIVPAFVALHAVAQGAPSWSVPAAFAAIAAQLALLAYDPRDQIPTRAATTEGRAFIDRLGQIPGPVLVPEHPWYAVLAGKEPSYHSCALWELRKTIGQDRWPADLRERLASHYYAAVVTAWTTAAPDLGSYPPELASSYRVIDSVTFVVRGALDTTTGKPDTRPLLIHVPRRRTDR